MNTPITYYGGKQNMLRHILPNLPEDHKLYGEPYFGGGAVFFGKPVSEIEVINDLNKEVINFYRILKERYEELYEKIAITLHSREQHRWASMIYANYDYFSKIERAWAFWTLSLQSFASNLIGGWAYDKASGSIERRLRNKVDSMSREYSERLRSTQIECNDAIKVIKSRDAKDSLFYCDPPYFNSEMGHYEGFSEDDFERLLTTLANIEGRFLLSSYPSDLLDKFAKKHKWHQIKVEAVVTVNSKKENLKTKVEMLTANYPLKEVA